MAPLALHEMRRNLFALDPSLHDFPKLQESSLKLSAAMFARLNTKVLGLHQRKLSHCQPDQQLEIVASDHQGLNHFVANSHVPASNFDFP